MKKIMILCDLLAREYWLCDKLRKKLVQMNYDLYLYQWNFEYYKAIKTSKKQLIDLLIIPSCYIAADYERVVMPLKKYNKDIKVLCMHTEQLGYLGDKNDLLVPKEDLVKNTMYHVAWGKYFADCLKETGVKSELIIEVGNLRLLENRFKHTKISRQELSEKYNLDKNKKWVLYSDSAGNMYYDLFKKSKKASDLIGCDKIQDEMIESYANTYLEVLKVLNNLSDDLYDNYEFIFRSHPGINNVENVEEYEEHIHFIKDYSIYTWFDHIEYNIVNCSTSIFESDAMGVKSLVFYPFKHKYDVVGIMEYTILHNKKELENILKLNDDEARLIINKDKYLHYIGNVNKTNIFDDFANKIENIINNSSKTLDIKCGINNKKKYSTFLADLMVKLFYSLKVLDYIKYPNSFNFNKYEHPIFFDNYKDK